MDKIAFVFAGQGAQHGGMGRALYESSAAARAVFDMADRFRPGTSEQCFSGTTEELSETKNTQPCLFCADLAAAESLRERGVIPDAAAGFSLGEIAALSFAGALSFDDGFRLVCKRGELMQRAAERNPGAMAAVLRLTDERVEKLCIQHRGVFPANYNCPGQVVAAGDIKALSEFCGAVAAEGGKTVSLRVSGAFHTPFMSDASQGLYEELRDYRVAPPRIPVFSNVTARPYEGDFRGLIAAQVRSPVLWYKTIENMVRTGVGTFIETGPGKTLGGMIKKTAPGVRVFNVEDGESLRLTLEGLKEGETQC